MTIQLTKNQMIRGKVCPVDHLGSKVLVDHITILSSAENLLTIAHYHPGQFILYAKEEGVAFEADTGEGYYIREGVTVTISKEKAVRLEIQVEDPEYKKVDYKFPFGELD